MASNSDNFRWAQVKPFRLLSENGEDSGCLVSVTFDHFSTLQKYLNDWLHTEEKLYYANLTAKRRQASYLLGRMAAKMALRNLSPGSSFNSINIRMGTFKDPVPCFSCDQPLQVGITHSSSMATSVAFPATHPMAIDLEDLSPQRAKVMEKHCHPREWNDLAGEDTNKTVRFTILWTAKEAISKVLRTGLTTSFKLMAVKELKKHAQNEWSGCYQHFTQYQFRSWLVENRVFTIVFPKQSTLVFPKQIHSPRLG